MAQQRRLAGPVASEQHDAFTGRERQRDPGEDRAVRRRARARPAAAAGWPGCARGGARRAARAPGGSGAGQQPGCAQRRARLLDPGGRRVQSEAGDQRGARGLERRRGARAPSRETRSARRRRRRAPASSAITRSAAPRQRSRRCSASRIVVPHSSLSRRSSASSSSPATGSSCEVGSSSTSSRGRPASAAPSATRWTLAARQVDGRALEQRLDAQRERDLLDPARDGDRAVAAVLERERQLRADRAHDDLRLRILEQRADVARERRRPVRAQVHAADLRASVEAAAVEVRNQAATRPRAASTCPSRSRRRARRTRPGRPRA